MSKVALFFEKMQKVFKNKAQGCSTPLMSSSILDSYAYCGRHTLDTSGTLPDKAAKHSLLQNTPKKSHNNNLHPVIVDCSNMWPTFKRYVH